ncbi:MAG: hypothetical protein CM1200mP38_5070 [Dehalococcoidia bacterium]|nr:MAG: hypothetical protein CM1200mP38_5070 [Dehalococcoidia bacterium]
MKILVKLFAAYRDKAGISEFSLEIPKDSNTVGDLAIEICSNSLDYNSSVKHCNTR